jgi:hypothetical protein
MTEQDITVTVYMRSGAAFHINGLSAFDAHRLVDRVTEAWKKGLHYVIACGDREGAEGMPVWIRAEDVTALTSTQPESR